MKKNGLQKGRLGAILYKLLMIMKLSIFIICFSVLTVVASGSYSQTTRMSISMSNSSIEDILKSIEDQSEFRFFYTEKLGVDQKVNVNFENSEIGKILDNILRDTNIKYKLLVVR